MLGILFLSISTISEYAVSIAGGIRVVFLGSLLQYGHNGGRREVLGVLPIVLVLFAEHIVLLPA